MPYWRAQTENVYFQCSRCGLRQPMSKMIWQAGILVCAVYNCIDDLILGQRDAMRAKALARLAGSDEAVPIRKLREPNIIESLNPILFQ